MIQPIIDSSGFIHIFKGKQTEPIKLMIGEILEAEILDIFSTGTLQLRINNRVINAQPQRELPLNKGDTVLLKVEKPFQDGTIPLRLISPTEIDEIKIPKIQNEKSAIEKILNLIENLFSGKKMLTEEANQFIINTIKTVLTIPTEAISDDNKEALLEKIINSLFSKATTLKNFNELIKLIEKYDFTSETVEKLKNLLITAERDINPEKIREALLNSGVSLEAKLKAVFNNMSKTEEIRVDLKALLYIISKEAKLKGFEEIALKAESIIRQIEVYQVLSKTYQSFFTFLPIYWSEIEGGDFAFKSLRRQGKEYYSVFVSLNFKEDGFLCFVVTLINKNFYVSFSGNEQFLGVIKNYEKELREQFKLRGMQLNGIKYFERVEELVKIWNIGEGKVSIKV